MSIEFHVIIPARFQSTRLPGKLLMELHGRSVLEWVYRRAMDAHPTSVTIATDSEEIYHTARSFGASVVMTAATHQTGTDRVAEVVVQRNLPADAIVVNVQGDEPLIAPALITQVAHSLAHSQAPMATLCAPLEDMEMAQNPNVVKVVRDCHGYALYFSRSLIPFARDKRDDVRNIYRHIGLYAYRANFLLQIVRMPVCALEATEALEQLRVLWSGHRIQVEEACTPPRQDINTAEDLEKARVLFNAE